MSNTTESKILGRIEKLLRLSESSNQHEAEAAMAMAVKLATLHDIDMSRVSFGEVETKIDKNTVSMGARMPVTFAYTHEIVSKFFKVKFVLGGSRNQGRLLHFIGKPDDIENAKFVFSFINTTFLRLWQEHYARNPYLNVATARKCYFLGLNRGLTEKLTVVQKETVDNSFTDSTAKESYQLVVVDYVKKLDEAAATFFTKLKAGTKVKREFVDMNSMQAGFVAGQDIQIHAGLTNNERIAIQ